MSKLAVSAVALTLAAVGFWLGHYTASRPDVLESDFERARPGASDDALGDVLRDPDAFSRARRLAILLPTLGPEAIPEVRKAIGVLARDLPALETVLLVRFWAAHEPQEATSYATMMPSGYGTAFPAVEVWAAADPEAAMTWVRAMMGVDRQSKAAEVALVRGWYASGRPGLEDYIRDLGSGFERQRALGAFAGAMIARDGPSAVMRWAESLPDDDEAFKQEAFIRVGQQLALADPAAAVAWCEAHCEGAFGQRLLMTVADFWAIQDAQAAMEWLSVAPASLERDQAVSEVFVTWLREDREGLLRWLKAMGPEGVEPWFLPAVSNSARIIATSEPEEAVRWAAVIEEPKRRERTFIQVARRWRLQDPAAAEAWLQQSPLSEEARVEAREEPRGAKRRQQQSRAVQEPSPDPGGP